MPIEHSQVSHLWNTSNSRHKYTTGAVSLDWPFPLPTASITYEPLSGSFSVSWIDQTEGILIEKGEIKVVFHDGGVACQRFRAGTFPPSPTGSLSFSATTVGTTGWGTISAKFDLASTGKDYAPAFAATLRSRVSSNVCFDFPRIGRQLWVNETILREASTYFENLFSSSAFADSSDSPNSSAKISTEPSPDLPPRTFDDSDDENDQAFAKRKSVESPLTPSLPPFKTITITDTSYSTYYSVLCWIGTGHIVFAPLRSNLIVPEGSNADSEEVESDEKPSSETPKPDDSPLPPPSSPKSVYRLAHFLQLPELANLALQNFGSQLNANNAAHELFGDTASSYPEVRKIALSFVVENWKQVVKSKSYEVVRSKAEKGDGDVGTALMLGERLMERWTN